MSTVTRTFLPWYREGFATQLTGTPTGGSARAALPATVALHDTSFTSKLPAELAGPGDVIGLDAAEILRVEPYDGCADFEPSYFAYVELNHCDLPWRFSPFGPEDSSLPGKPGVSAARLRPWLCLAVVRADLATLSGAPTGGLPILSVDASQLPDPSEAWAWAHVQVVTGAGEQVANALDDASLSLARIVGPRRLDAATRYLACLVPTFAAGRAALVSGAPAGDPLAPAWPADGTVQLPVYFSWSFTTGGAGSFETFARRLRPVSSPPTLAGGEIATDSPGWGARSSPGTRAVMEGALRPVGVAESPADSTLAESLRAAISSDGSGVQLRPPVYGQDYAGGATGVPAATGWLAELNTDPRRRIAAGLAAWAVAVDQEDLADRAWRQLAEHNLNVPTQTSTELSEAVNGSLARHDAAARPGAPAALARLMRAGGPLSALGAASALVKPADSPAPSDASTVAPASTDARFAPVMDEPAYAYLRGIAQEWLLPGAGDIPDDSVLLVESNTGFVEAFMVGLNHALARELAWRRYPIDPTKTMFQTFWASTAGDADVGQIADWPSASALGSHTHRPDQLVLLLRGALFRRFPTAQIYLSKTDTNGAETHLTANISGSLGADIVFLGFPLTPADALAADPGWSIVIQESVHHARFGVDDAPSTGTGALVTWQDLDWGNPQFAGHSYVPIAGPLLGAAHPIGADNAATATWGASAANQAVALQQPAFRIRIPIALWLTPLTSAHG